MTCQKHTEHILGIHLPFAGHSQWMHRATLPMGVNDGGKEEKKRRFPSRAAAAYDRQLKSGQLIPSEISRAL